MCAHPCLHGLGVDKLKGVSTSSWSRGEEQMGWMRDRGGETADGCNPHPAQASVGVMRSGPPLMMQPQHLND